MREAAERGRAIGGILLAAGSGSRFGEPKQLAELDGRPLIEHSLAVIEAVPAIDPIVVVLGAEAGRVRAEADLNGAEVVVADDWSEGMAASLRAGVGAHADADAVLVMLADQPLITAQVVAAIADQVDQPAPAARATYDGAPGHPVLIKRELFGSVGALRGDAGARDLLEAHGATAVECGRLCRPDDVDTDADLEAIRRRGASAGAGG
jgi:CTP:molybdopterin cytidylyltransferase MocA